MKIKIIAFFFIFPFIFSDALSRVHDYETTRLKSTGGTGVASILMDESAILNPAPVAFFNISSLYVQKVDVKIKGDDSGDSSRPYRYNLPDDTNGYGVIAADAKSTVKGAVSYQKQKEWYDQRKRISVGVASLIGVYSSLGVLFRHTRDTNSVDGDNYVEDNYNQFVVGASHGVMENFFLGVIVVDPLRRKEQDTKVIIGGQYQLRDMLVLMADFGSDYKNDISDTLLYRFGLQVRFFSDFYLRGGYFRDNGLKEKGNGVGIGWVSPRLVAELALKTTEFFYSQNNYRGDSYPPHKMRELSMSLSYRF